MVTPRPHGIYLKMLTARATTSPRTASEPIAWMVMASLLHRAVVGELRTPARRGNRRAAIARVALRDEDRRQQQNLNHRNYPVRADAEPGGQQQQHDHRQHEGRGQHPSFLGAYPGPHHFDPGCGPVVRAFPQAGPPVADARLGLRGGRCAQRNGVGFGDQRASGIQDLGYLHVAAGGRHGDDKGRCPSSLGRRFPGRYLSAGEAEMGGCPCLDRQARASSTFPRRDRIPAARRRTCCRPGG